MEDCSDPQEAVAVLHVALYYSCPRLAHLCELRLAALLRPDRAERRAAKAQRGGDARDEEGETPAGGGAGCCKQAWRQTRVHAQHGGD